jgi:hypothetical protein
VSYADLKTRGYAVVPGFLHPEELEALRADYRDLPDAGNQNYAIRLVTPAMIERMTPKLLAAAQQVKEQSGVHTDRVYAGAYFANTAIDFSWHQDHESYFMFQDHYDQLNFWIPLHKPARDKSGICVLDLEDLREKHPEAWEQSVRAGARHYELGPHQTEVRDDSNDKYWTWPFSLEPHARTPELEAGDLLVIRGDMIHRTQDTETERVAVSFRLARSSTFVRRSVLVQGGRGKIRKMLGNWRTYVGIFKCFDEAGKEVLTIEELLALADKLKARAPAVPKTGLRAWLMAGAGQAYLVSRVLTARVRYRFQGT